MLTKDFKVIFNSCRCLESYVSKVNKNTKKNQRNKIKLGIRFSRLIRTPKCN